MSILTIQLLQIYILKEKGVIAVLLYYKSATLHYGMLN